MINDLEPHVGDDLYDIQLGYGKLTTLEPSGGFVLTFSGGRTLRYSRGGYVGTSRRVYWANPVIIEPSRDRAYWAEFTKLVREMDSMLRSGMNRVRNMGDKDEN